MTRLPSKGGGRSLLVDLNQDSYLDLVFCNFIHNYGVETDAMIYWGSREGFQPNRRTLLPTLLGSAVAAADFNRDGFVDLAIANHGIEGWKRFGTAQHLESYIYWNGPTGFSSRRRTVVPSISALDVAAGDLNRDGFPELLFVNNNSEEKSVFLYWGGPGGFSVERRDQMDGGDPVGLRLSDLDKDGTPDLVVTHRDDRAQLFKGGPQGFPEEPWAELPTSGAVRCEVAELNRDGFPDLIVANRGEKPSTIYWGGAQGFETGRRTDLPTLDASDAVTADFNRDGWIDLAFANEGDARTHDVPSYIYWNGPRGFDPSHRLQLQGVRPRESPGRRPESGRLSRPGAGQPQQRLARCHRLPDLLGESTPPLLGRKRLEGAGSHWRGSGHRRPESGRLDGHRLSQRLDLLGARRRIWRPEERGAEPGGGKRGLHGRSQSGRLPGPGHPRRLGLQ